MVLVLFLLRGWVGGGGPELQKPIFLFLGILVLREDPNGLTPPPLVLHFLQPNIKSLDIKLAYCLMFIELYY